MKQKNNSILSSPLLFIIFFLVGTIIFVIMTTSIDIPIYESYEGIVVVNDNQTIIKVDRNVPIVDYVFYYTNRDQWIEKSSIYNEIYEGYELDNVRGLEDGIRVQIDVQVGTISLFDAIVKKDGNI